MFKLPILSWLHVTCAAVVIAAFTSSAHGQSEIPLESTGRPHIVLPGAWGTTALSAQIHAEAAYVASLGDFVESVAIARRHHAAAREHEIRNSLLWVTTYFERREVNRAHWLKENPSYLDRQESIARQEHRRISDNPHLVIAGDVTDELNGMLTSLAGPSLVYQVLPGGKPLEGSELDVKLTAADLTQIRLTDGGRAAGHVIIFRASDASVLHHRWPRVLRAPVYNDMRENFERARDRFLGEIEAKKVPSYEAEQELMKAVDAMCSVFNSQSPGDLRDATREFVRDRYITKRFLQSLAGRVHRAIETDNMQVFDGSYRFKGETLIGLIQHMYKFGLEFAPPESGAEGVYRKLFFATRGIYSQLTTNTNSRKS